MNCPFCNASSVTVILTQKYRTTVRRVRFCQQCGMAWRTFEDSPVCCDCGTRDSNVISSDRFTSTVVRARKCPTCNRSWKTYENVIDEYRTKQFLPRVAEEPFFKRKYRQRAGQKGKPDPGRCVIVCTDASNSTQPALENAGQGKYGRQ